MAKDGYDWWRRRLTHMRDELQAKIPGARAYVRVGLDEPAASVRRV